MDVAHHGLRIDTFLASRLRNHAAARLQRLAAAGLVTVNDGPCPPDRRVARGEEVTVRLAEPPEPFFPAERLPLVVLYEDVWLLAVNKPAGMIVHPAGAVETGTLVHAAQAHLDVQARRPGLLRPGVVHRLDVPTSGVLLIAKDATAHAGLTWQFERGDVQKCYLALAEGHPATDGAATIDLPIGRRETGPLMVASAEAREARAAVTEYRVIKRLRTATLLAVRPRTGRKHQIRVHLAAVGHPVIGDDFYAAGGGLRPRRGAEEPAPPRHALHAAAIAFRHPITNAPLRIIAPVQADFWEPLAGPGR